MGADEEPVVLLYCLPDVMEPLCVDLGRPLEEQVPAAYLDDVRRMVVEMGL